MQLSRRQFLETSAILAVASRSAGAQTPAPAAPTWPSPVIDGDLSANSGNNALSRDAAFTADFLRRHQDKLHFGSDCGCADGNGSGVSQANNPAASRLAGKCVARETLGLLQRSTTPEIFRKLVWDNAHRLYRIA